MGPEVVQYIVAQLKIGVKPVEIKKSLITVGWKEEDVVKAIISSQVSLAPKINPAVSSNLILNNSNNQSNFDGNLGTNFVENQPEKRSALLIRIFSILLILIIFCGVAYITYLSPKRTLGRMLSKTAKSLSFDVVSTTKMENLNLTDQMVKNTLFLSDIKVAQLGGKKVAGITSSNDSNYALAQENLNNEMTITTRFKGSVGDVTNGLPKEFFAVIDFGVKGNLAMGQENLDMTFNMVGNEIRWVNNTLYFKINIPEKLPEMLSLVTGGIKAFNNKWIMVKYTQAEIDAINQEINNKDVKEVQAEVKKLLAKGDLFNTKIGFPVRVLNGKPQIYYQYNSLNQNALFNLSNTINKVDIKQITAQEKENAKKDFENAFKDMPKIEGGIWTGLMDSNLYKMTSNLDLSQDSFKSSETIDANFSNYNQLVKVEEPVGAMPFEDLMTSLMNDMLSADASNDLPPDSQNLGL